jgi:hypothetical protein
MGSGGGRGREKRGEMTQTCMQIGIKTMKKKKKRQRNNKQKLKDIITTTSSLKEMPKGVPQGAMTGAGQ